MLRKPSARRLPYRSGIAIVVSSSTWVKPGGSPLGETSQLPSAPAVATRQNGDAASHCRSRGCRAVRSFVIARAAGNPSTSLSSASVVISRMTPLSAIGAPPSVPTWPRYPGPAAGSAPSDPPLPA